LSYSNIEVEQQGPVATLWLNRPQVRNAMDEVLIAELTQAVNRLQQDASVRVLVLAGRGSAFCAGADLNWMKRMAGFSEEQNREDARGLAKMLRTLHACEKPVIARVHGPAFAGGMGLAAACDIVVAGPAAEFCLTEVRIGLVPATISPYVVRALGMQASRRYMLTAERITASEAHRIGFVQVLATDGDIDDAVAGAARALAAGGPCALARTKSLIDQVAGRALDDGTIDDTALLIAEVRAGAEARDGIPSFLEKRKPTWIDA
jgi:methylglutaconyl-CoA hydratase